MSILDYIKEWYDALWNKLADAAVSEANFLKDAYDNITWKDVQWKRLDNAIDNTDAEWILWNLYKYSARYWPGNSYKQEYLQNQTNSLISETSKQLPKIALDLGINSKDIALNKQWLLQNKKKAQIINQLWLDKYLNNDVAKSIVANYNNDKWLVNYDTATAKTKEIKPFYDELNAILQPKINTLLSEWKIDKAKASQLFRTIEDYANKTNTFSSDLDSNPAIKNDKWIQTLLTARKQYIKEYAQQIWDKLIKYNGDMEKLENDPDLTSLWHTITNLDDNIRNTIAEKSFTNTNVFEHPILSAKRGITALEWLATSWIWMEWRALEWGYNSTLWRITGTHLEQWAWIQQDLNKNWITDDFVNFTTDVAPWVIDAVWWIWAIWKLWVLWKLWETLAENEHINWIFNSYFDPWVSNSTANTDIAFDVWWEILWNTIWTLIWKWLDTAAIKKYWKDLDDTVEFKVPEVDKEWKILYKTKKMSIWDILKSPDKFPDFLNKWSEEIAKTNLSAYNTLLNKTIWKLEDLSKKKSWLLVRRTKKQIIDWISKNLEDLWLAKQGKILQELSTSKEWVNKVFDNIKDIFNNYKTQVDNLLVKNNRTLEQNAILLNKNWFTEAIARKLEEPDANVLPTPAEVKVQAKIKNNIPLNDEDIIETLPDSIFKVLKNNKNEMDFSTFKEKVLDTLRTNVWWKLPEPYRKNIVKALENAEWFSKKLKIKRQDIIWWDEKYLWSSNIQKQEIRLKLLKWMYKNNPEDFFVVLFHELSHNRGYEFFKKMFKWEKAQEHIDSLFWDLLVGYDLIKKDLPPETRKELDRLAENKEEFLAYIIWDQIVKWNTKLLDKFIDTVNKYWKWLISKDEANEIKGAITKYINSRFLQWKPEELWILWKSVNYATSIWKNIKEWAKIMKYNLRWLIKHKNNKTLDAVISWMTREDIIKTLRSKELWEVYKKVKKIINNMSDDELRDTLRYYIKMDLAWENWFKAAALWNTIWDILEGKKYIPYLSDIIWDVKAEDLLKALQDWKIPYTKLWKSAWTALDLLLHSEHMDPVLFNQASVLWKHLLDNAWIKLKAWNENTFNRILEYLWSKYDISEASKWVNDLLASIWYTLIDSSKWAEIKRRILNGTFNINDFKDSIKQIWWDKTQLAEYNYSKYNADLAHTLNKIAGINDSKLYKHYKWIEQFIKSNNLWDDIAKTRIEWVPQKYWRYIANKEWNNLIYTDKSWREILYKWNTWEAVILDNWQNIFIKSITDDRTSRWFSLIDDVYNENNYQMFLNTKTILEKCL